jgi:hypothetical protein
MKRIVTFAFILLSCTSKISDDKLTDEAISLHHSMIKKSNMIRHRLNELQKDPAVNQDSVAHFLELLKQWETDLVEVPGDEDHVHGTHSHHDHPPHDVTPEQMLEIQKDLDARLGNIGKNTTKLKPHNDDGHQHYH